ncbi:MAG: site-specific DNA-methyltransferase [Prolixibacteraceae bacterium]|jgi:adenine-specific DNA-methyltransferase|nr:site-specific DNA-methyltransferase [Prolixibacteraceae bacterium]
MPTLHWIGKEKVINHHLDVPFKVLEHSYGFDNGKQSDKETNSGNKIIHGDNLEALKALLPEYEGRINCIYIDPPYNTGNEGWVYNDNVNDPKFKKWLNSVVGKEGEDLSRHDKWLCMMYPRLKLLHKLLADDGLIFISIDNFEFNYLSLILEEIFGRKNCIETIVWKKSYGGGAKSKHLVNLHEYIFFYAKNIEAISELTLAHDESILKYYKFQDDKINDRGPYRLQPLATTSMDDRPNLRYPITFEGEDIWPTKQWQWSKERVVTALQNNDLVIEKKKGKWSVNYKQYLKSIGGVERGRKLYSIIEGIYTQQGTSELKALMPETKFTFPKPPILIQTLLELVTKKDSIILDSFAGSGSTAHAVINLNNQDGGNRKFILAEMESYAEDLTAERIKRIMNGSSKAIDDGSNFDFYELGQPIFSDEGVLNELVGIQKIRQYVFYTETKQRLKYDLSNLPDDHDSFLGKHNDTAYYFYYAPEKVTTLNHEFLATLKTKAEQYVIYADNCLLTKEYMTKNHIIFKKIPRDITRF